MDYDYQIGTMGDDGQIVLNENGKRLLGTNVALRFSYHECPRCLATWTDQEPRNPDCESGHPLLCCGGTPNEVVHKLGCKNDPAYKIWHPINDDEVRPNHRLSSSARRP